MQDLIVNNSSVEYSKVKISFKAPRKDTDPIADANATRLLKMTTQSKAASPLRKIKSSP